MLDRNDSQHFKKTSEFTCWLAINIVLVFQQKNNNIKKEIKFTKAILDNDVVLIYLVISSVHYVNIKKKMVVFRKCLYSSCKRTSNLTDLKQIPSHLLGSSADLEVQLMQLNHCDGVYSNYWNTLLRNLKLTPYINFYV